MEDYIQVPRHRFFLAHKSKPATEIRMPLSQALFWPAITFAYFIELRALNAELLPELLPVSMMFVYLMLVGFISLSNKREHVEHRTTFKTF